MDSSEQLDRTELGALPLLGDFEQRLFAIENTRERADRLQAELVPKLLPILDEACELILEIYGEEALLPFRFPTTPAHRPGGQKTKSYDEATAGIAVVGQVWLFQQRFVCTSDNLYVTMFGIRGLESNPIVQVLKDHTEGVIRLLELDQYEIWSSALEEEAQVEQLDLEELIAQLRPSPDLEWEATRITGPSIALPITDLDAAWSAIFDFAALFPIFRAATDVLQGQHDGFDRYSECFWSWLEKSKSEEPANRFEAGSSPPVATSPDENESAWEGGFDVVYRRHRRREKRLRARKIREVLRREGGRLRCEVANCGFDFFEVYGELGRDFAHVHHVHPLSDRSQLEKTELADLAIVCANCHSMIHRGRKCLPLDALSLRRP